MRASGARADGLVTAERVLPLSVGGDDTARKVLLNDSLTEWYENYIMDDHVTIEGDVHVTGDATLDMNDYILTVRG